MPLQISNWFINARVRLWKPMIEDMYKEEIGDIEQDSNSSSDNAPRSKGKMASSEDKEDLKSSTPRVCESSQMSESRDSIGTMNVGGAAVGFQNEANPDRQLHESDAEGPKTKRSRWWPPPPQCCCTSSR